MNGVLSGPLNNLHSQVSITNHTKVPIPNPIISENWIHFKDAIQEHFMILRSKSLMNYCNCSPLASLYLLILHKSNEILWMYMFQCDFACLCHNSRFRFVRLWPTSSNCHFGPRAKYFAAAQSKSPQKIDPLLGILCSFHQKSLCALESVWKGKMSLKIARMRGRRAVTYFGLRAAAW